MRNGTKLAFALSTVLAVAACNEEDSDNTATNTEQKNTTTISAEQDTTQASDTSGPSLTTLEGVVLTRNGETFTADIRGHCADYVLDDQTCAEYLTERVQTEALTHNFFTATTNKLSTDPAFIDAGLTGNTLPEQREAREEAIARRLATTTDEALAERLENRPNNTFYIIDSVSDLDLADSPLVDMAPE